MKTTDIFTSFIAYEYLNLDLSALERYCHKAQEISPGRVISNYGGWQSNDLPLEDPETVDFRNAINREISKLLETQGLSTNFKISNYWLNVNNRGDFNRPHSHGFSTLAGVFYIKAPLGSGKLVLRNPIQAHGFCIDEKFIKNWNAFNSITWEIEPEENKLLLWPAWIDHYTFPNTTNDERISIAFNVDVF